MINNIQLVNFQSHEDTRLELHPGINAIVGSSDSGKSAILRALYWAITNRPSGDAYVSYWAKNEKGKQTKPTAIRITNSRGILARERTKDFNGYIIGDNTLEAVRTDVPDEVNEFFNLSEVNIQKQMDSPFLLSESSGEVSRFFNRIIKLDTIDKALSLVDGKRRLNKTNIDTLSTTIEAEEKALTRFDWIEKLEPIAEKLGKVHTKIAENQKQHDTLVVDAAEHEKCVQKLAEKQAILKAEKPAKELGKIQELIENEQGVLEKLEKSLTRYNVTALSMVQKTLFLDMEGDANRLIKMHENIEKQQENLSKYEKSLKKYAEISDKIPIIRKELKELESQMPDTCPICGKPLGDMKDGC